MCISDRVTFFVLYFPTDYIKAPFFWVCILLYSVCLFCFEFGFLFFFYFNQLQLFWILKLQAKHSHLDVQRIAVRCLGLFGLLEIKPSEELVKQLKLSFAKGPAPISIVACKALFDLGMCHQPQEVDRAVGQNMSPQLQDYDMTSSPLDISDIDGNWNPKLLDLLYAGLIKDDWDSSLASEENESVQGALGEGFAKILLLSENYKSIPACSNPLLLSKLITLYFSNESKELQR